VHVGPRTGLPHDRSGAADVIKMMVSKNQVLELIRRTAETANRLKDGCLLTRETGVDQRQPIVPLDQEGVCLPHRDNVHTFDHTLYSHRQTPSRSEALVARWQVPEPL
jgi:hypothetical protein